MNKKIRRVCHFFTLYRISEIPIFHVLNARITFGNIFASDSPAEKVSCIKDSEGGPLCCVVDETIFEAPNTYSTLGMIGMISYNILSVEGYISSHNFRFILVKTRAY